jgi:AcrR family transcriptional regulator
MYINDKQRISRARILEGARDLLDAGVYGDLTVDALSRSLHMSKSTLYKHFVSKDEVIHALIEHLCAHTDRELDALDLHGGSAQEALAALMDIHAAHAQRMPRAVVLQHARLPESCQDRVDLTRARITAGLREVLHRGGSRRALPPMEATLTACALLASAEAAAIASARGEVPSTRAEAVHTVIGLLMPEITRRWAVAA